MLNFDEQRYLDIQSGALALAGSLRETIGALLDEGRETVIFAGAGGAGMLMQPAAGLLARRSRVPTFWDRPAELMATDPVYCDEKAIVVLPSLSGTTSESVDLIEKSHEVGATVLALTGHETSPIAAAADHNFTNFAEDDTSSESFYLQSLLVALSVLDHEGVGPDFEAVAGELETLPASLVAAKAAFEERAEQWAEAFRDEDYHIISAAGPLWAEAWYYGTCILEEMQWIRTRPIHAADFFHGTLELLEPEVSLILLKGGGSSRPSANRVEDFAGTVSEKVRVLDTEEFELPGVSEEVRELVSPAVASALLERVSAHLEVKRDHPLTTRRYYRRMDY
jgi:fructoselysine-6-phosphate deglycase